MIALDKWGNGNGANVISQGEDFYKLGGWDFI